MKKFEINHIYAMRSPGDHNCIWRYLVTKRTAQTVTLSDGKGIKTFRISKTASEYTGSETVYPLGQYSLCPVLHAE